MEMAIHILGGVTVTDLETNYRVPYPYTLTNDDVEVINGEITSCSYNFLFKDIIIPTTLDGQTVIGIGYETFYGKGITTVQLPSTIQTIENRAFSYNSISSLDFSNCINLTSIGYSAFIYNSITSFVLPTPNISGSSFTNWQDMDNNTYAGGSSTTNLSTYYTATFSHLPIIFTVTNDGTNPLENATVNLTGYGSQTTNTNGITTYNNIAVGESIDYTVSYTNYENVLGSIYLSSNNYILTNENVIVCENAINVNGEICDGEVYNFQGIDYSEMGSYPITLINQLGCDSIVTLNLTVNPLYEFIEEHTICEGEIYTWQGIDYANAGTYTVEYTSVTGCDSTYILNLSIPIYDFTEEYSICEGEIYTWQGVNYTDAGTYTAEYTSVTGCDSTYTLNLTVNPNTIITAQPQNVNATIGDDISFSTSADNATGYQWRYAGSDIGGANQSAYYLADVQTSHSGNYDVVVSGECGNVTSDIAVLDVTVSIEKLSDYGISIYPNPSNGMINIEFSKSNSNYNFSIIDMTGEVIYSNILPSSLKQEIDLNSYSKGVYFIKFNINGEILISKLILK